MNDIITNVARSMGWEYVNSPTAKEKCWKDKEGNFWPMDWYLTGNGIRYWLRFLEKEHNAQYRTEKRMNKMSVILWDGRGKYINLEDKNLESGQDKFEAMMWIKAGWAFISSK